MLHFGQWVIFPISVCMRASPTGSQSEWRRQLNCGYVFCQFAHVFILVVSLDKINPG